MGTRRAELVSAFGLLTRLPVTGLAPPGVYADRADSVWAYPFAGLAVGLIGGLTYWLVAYLGVPAMIAGVIALGAMVLTTGGLHEDGLADAADGLGGGTDKARKLEIMRDSRIGSYGVIALVLVFALRLGAIVTLADVSAVAAALIGAAVLSRGVMGPFMHFIGPARSDGLSAGVGRPGGRVGAESAAIAALLAFLVLSPGVAVAALVAVVLATAAVAWLAQRQIGGQTGDIVGAAGIAAECAALTVIAAAA